MAAITGTQLATRVLQHIGVIDSNETPTAADNTLVLAALDAVLSGLSVDQMNDGITSASIPDWAQPMIRDLVAYEVAMSFGVPVDPMLRPRALTRLRHQFAQDIADINAPVRRSPIV